MGRLARAALVGCKTRRICDMHHYPPSGTCPHAVRGELTNGSSNVIIEGIPAVRVGDNEDCNCPHSGIGAVSSGSGSVFINGRPAARVKDGTTCYFCFLEGSIVDGAQTVFVG